MGYKLRTWVTPKSLHRGSVHFHSCPFSVHTLTFLLRPRRSAARTVPRVLAATSLLSKGIRPSTLCSSRLDPRCCCGGGRQLSRSWHAAGGSPSPPSPGALAARSAAAVGAVRPGTEAGQGWPRLPHWLRAGRGGGGQESGSRGAEQAGMHPGRPADRRRLRAAGGGRAEVSLGARRGRRLSMPSPQTRGAGAVLREGAWPPSLGKG